MTEPLRILIVEDDEDIASALSRGLAAEGYEPLTASDAVGAVRLAARGCDAAIIDVMLGDDHGLDLVRALRKSGVTFPIIMLSALSGVEERAAGLAAGADDYVAKPFEFTELVARLQVQQHRRAAEPGVPSLLVDPETREVSTGQRAVILTQRECDLLQYMLSHTDKVLSRGEIFDALWLSEGGSSENVVDVYLGYLRRKLAPVADFGIEIRTVRGRGFILKKLKET
jgi:DNA-binding response OmpR family regulator